MSQQNREEIERQEEKVKIIVLHDKWRYVRSDDSDEGTRCRNIIQGKAIAIASEQTTMN
jgi:hypothetical protein